MPTLTEQIRTALARRDGVPEAAMRELAADYSTRVAGVNERLSRAADLIRNGLRAEAIQLVKMPPDALDAAAALDFPEFDEWCEILQFYGIGVPDELQRELVDRVNEAFAESLPLEATLRQHRRLAIARAPLRTRLKILRRIAELDPLNPVWEDDLETWETARLKELAEEVRQAINSSDPEELDALHQELSATAWRAEPDAKLVDSIRRAVRSSKQQALRESLVEVAEQVHDAFCQFDDAATRSGLQRWDELVQKLDGDPPAELLDQVDPAAAWIKQIDAEASERAERSAAVGKFERLLTQHADRVTLDAAYQACRRFDEPIPEELITRYRLLIEQHELRDRRRNQTIIAAIFAVTLIAIGSIVFWQITASQERNIVAAQQRLEPMLQAGQLLEAESFWGRLEEVSPTVAADARLVALRGRLEGMRAEEDARAKQFAEYLAQADVDSPETVDYSALAKAEKLAANEEEKGATFKVRKRYNQWSQELEAGHTEGLLSELEALRARLDEIEASAIDSVDMGEFPRLAAELGEAKSRYPRAAATAKSQIAGIQTRADAMRDALRERRGRMQSESDALRRIAAATTLNRLESSLTDFARKAPDSPLAQEFAAAAANRPHWDRLDEWNRTTATIASAIRGSFKDVQAGQLREQLATMEQEFAGNPASDSRSSINGVGWRDSLRRYDERLRLLDEILGDLGDTVHAELYTLIIKGESGDRLFVHKSSIDNRTRDFVSAGQRQGLEVVSNGAGAVRRDSFAAPFEVIREPYESIHWLVSVHGASASRIAVDWEREMLKLVGLCRARSGLDAQIKEMLIQHLLAGACRGSEPLIDALADELLVLKQRATKRERWFEAVQPSDRLDSEVEGQVISKVVSLYKTLPTSEQIAERLTACRYEWAGCVLKSRDGVLYPSLHLNSPGDGHLVAAVASTPDDDKTEVVMIGTISDGAPSLHVGNRPPPAGTPLFFLADIAEVPAQ